MRRRANRKSEAIAVSDGSGNRILTFGDENRLARLGYCVVLTAPNTSEPLKNLVNEATNVGKQLFE